MIGLTMGKFMPLHVGHVRMIEFALEHVDELIVLVVTKDNEVIDGALRTEWLEKTFADEPRVKIRRFHHQLPHDGNFTTEKMDQWCEAIKVCIPQVDIIITSEDYGAYLADYLGATQLVYDKERTNTQISGTMIRENPNAYLDYLPECVKAFYAKEETHS